MDLTDDLTFDDCFNIFTFHARNLGYNGPFDKYTHEDDYLQCRTPEYAAELFANEMNK